VVDHDASSFVLAESAIRAPTRMRAVLGEVAIAPGRPTGAPAADAIPETAEKRH
jgi:hypothetical protein